MTDRRRAIWNMGGDFPQRKVVLIIEEKWEKMWDIQKH